jgi:hypothetical protein
MSDQAITATMGDSAEHRIFRVKSGFLYLLGVAIDF